MTKKTDILYKFRFIWIIAVCFIAPLYSEEINPEKINNAILNPAVFVPTEAEENGLLLKVPLNELISVRNEKGSARYDELAYDKENNVITGKVYSREERSDYSWKFKSSGNSGDYIVAGSHKLRLTFNNDRKPVKLDYRGSRVNERIEDVFIDQGKFYIPPMILKPGDRWNYYFTDIKNFSEKGTSEPKYYSIEVKADFKLSGYTDYESERAAVITSEISIRKVFVLLFKRDTMEVSGGTYVYDITSVNQLLIDVKTGSPLYCTTGILKKVRGSLHDSWGKNPEEAEKNVLQNYEGFINGNETNYTVYYIKYINPARKKRHTNN